MLVSAGDDGIRKHYNDHAIIFGLGLHSCVNVPLVNAGKCIGTLNVLSARADWDKEQVGIVRELGIAALAGALALKA